MARCRGVQYVLNMMHRCIMVKLGESQKRKRTKIGLFINFAEIWGNMQYESLAYGGWMPLVRWPRGNQVILFSEEITLNSS